MRLRDLRFGHMGNGLVCFDTKHEVGGDYEKLAHINSDRTIDYYTDLSNTDRLLIESTAAFSDSNISQTQEAKVFRSTPLQTFDETKYKIVIETYNSGRVFTAVTFDGEEVTDGYSTYFEAVNALHDEI